MPDSELVISRLIISCSDRPGIVAAVSAFLQDSGANIMSSYQYSTDPQDGAFFIRTVFAVPQAARSGLEDRFAVDVADRFGMNWRMWDVERKKRVAILVSGHEHCLLELLWRWRRGTLAVDIPFVASNHDKLRGEVERFGLPFHHIPVVKGEKPAAEAALLELISDQADVVVLARYMQILSGDFLSKLGIPVINIHHSFLPAFEGAGPYEKAKERGVKLIGATGHYVTEDLDAGPIIEQDVIRVTHNDDTAALTRLGADVERAVFARAVQWHCEDRVLVHGNTTVIF